MYGGRLRHETPETVNLGSQKSPLIQGEIAKNRRRPLVARWCRSAVSVRSRTTASHLWDPCVRELSAGRAGRASRRGAYSGCCSCGVHASAWASDPPPRCGAGRVSGTTAAGMRARQSCACLSSCHCWGSVTQVESRCSLRNSSSMMTGGDRASCWCPSSCLWRPI